MASNGLNRKAQKGKCRMCLRVRDTGNKVKAVGEVLHGFATGHIWECTDINECDTAAANKLSGNALKGEDRAKMERAKAEGRFTEYKRYS